MTKGKNAIYGRLLCGVVAVLMALMLFPVRPTTAAGYVAQIGDTKYETFADAAAAAQDGDTITLLQDCESELTRPWAIDKNITITGNYTVTFNEYSFGIHGDNTLTIDGSKVVVKNANHTAYSDKVDNAAIMLDQGATLTLDNGASLIIDSPVGDGIATWDVVANNTVETLNVLNGSTYELKNASNGGGVEDYNGDSFNVNVNVINESRILVQSSYSGFIGTLDITIDNSVVDVFDSRGNGSNGSNYYISNGSTVTFSDNGSHGISATDLVVETGSQVIAKDNACYGAYAKGQFKVDGTSSMVVTGNSYGGDYAGLKLTSGVTDGKVESGAVVTITDNYCSGLSNNGKVVFEEGVKLTIMNNVNDKGSSSYGGGVYNSGSAANLTLPSNAIIYNNHAVTAGDDIFNSTTSTISFGSVGNDWYLDGVSDCTDRIDGWYDDSTNARWEAHGTDLTNHVESVTAGSYTEPLAIKAAHDLTPDVVTGVDKTSNGANSIGQVNAGSVVPFEVTLSVPTVGGSLQVSDQMLNMTFNNDLTLNGQSVSYTAQDSGFTLTIPEGYRGQTITLRYTGTVIQDVKDGDSVSNTVYFDSKYDTVTGTVSVQASKPDDYSLTIRKLWENDDATVRPDSITVDIYNDGELVDSVELYEKYGWRYNYPIEEYEVNDDWWVEEADVPAYYDSTVQEVRDNVFYITNTYDEPVIEEPVSSEPESSEPSSEPSEVTPSGPSEEPSSPSSEPSAPSSEPVSEPAESAEPAEPTLPQTGQLWWPVPALFACGAVLVAFGAFKHRRGNGRHER